MSSKTYRSALPYRKPMRYSGADTLLPIDGFNAFSNAAGPWDKSTPDAVLTTLSFDGMTVVNNAMNLPWAMQQARAGMWQLPLRQITEHGAHASLPFSQFALQANATSNLQWQQYSRHDASSGLPWGDLPVHAATHVEVPWIDPSPHASGWALPWGELPAQAATTSAGWRAIAAQGAYVALPWSALKARSEGVDIDWVVDPDPDPGTITIPELPVYIMLPTLTAVRLPDRTPLPLLSISIDVDTDTWAWSFSAPMARQALELVNPDAGGDPPEIEVTINGYVWTFVVDAYDDNRRFGSNTLTLRGRSRSALLAEPHAPKRTYTQTADRTAAQLADEELTSTGWTMVWDAQDWLVPGGTFGYQDLTPMEAIAMLANSIGASVHSDAETTTITVSPAYPISPWSWAVATPYAILPAAVLTEGSSSWKGGINPDGVYVYAENAPTGAFVKITGSAGAVQLPMIVDRLAVHADAQRERGRAELSRYGKGRTVQRTMPLFPTPPPPGMPDIGVVPIGSLVEVEDKDGDGIETWRGQVMAVRIDAQRNGRALSVRQHLTIERQFR